MAIALFAGKGWTVIASTGRRERGRLSQVARRGRGHRPRDAQRPRRRPLGKEHWAAAVDSVGSTTLANVLAQTRYGGAVAACGLAGGMDLPATVAPFILRGVSLLGIESVQCPSARRLEAWRRLALDLDRAKLAAMTETIPFDRGVRRRGPHRQGRDARPARGDDRMRPRYNPSARAADFNKR